MARSANKPNPVVILIVVVVLVAIGAYVWLHRRHAPAETQAESPAKGEPAVSALAVPSDKIDPSNEGRVVSVSGKLSVQRPARDTQLGVSADAIMLLRFVEMLQWRETCNVGHCTYQQVWSPQVIDSRRFHEPESHTNPKRLPLTIARFSAGDMRLGAFVIDASALGNERLDSALALKPVPLPVKAADLPSNLSISFRDENGALYAGDPAHRTVGDVRVRYRTIPAGSVELIGKQQGDRLLVQKSKPNPSS
jgi:transmembrane protein TMEM43